jgi:hypothetical protein
MRTWDDGVFADEIHSPEPGGSDKRNVPRLACRTWGNERRVAYATDISIVGTVEDP